MVNGLLSIDNYVLFDKMVTLKDRNQAIKFTNGNDISINTFIKFCRKFLNENPGKVLVCYESQFTKLSRENCHAKAIIISKQMDIYNMIVFDPSNGKEALVNSNERAIGKSLNIELIKLVYGNQTHQTDCIARSLRYIYNIFTNNNIITNYKTFNIIKNKFI